MAKKQEPQQQPQRRPRGRPRSDASTFNRSVFYAKDPETEQIIAAIIENLRKEGVPGVSGSQAVSWALHQAAKMHKIGPYKDQKSKGD